MEVHDLVPIGSMYGIYANIWGIWMVNVTIYSIHGSYGVLKAMATTTSSRENSQQCWKAHYLMGLYYSKDWG